MNNKCICEGNWRNIVAKTEHLLDKKFMDKHGNVYRFFGIVHGSDDYYYGMYGKNGLALLSCVGNFEGHNFKLIEE